MLVYRSYDQEQLDKQYNVRAGIPDFKEVFARWAEDSAAFRGSVPVRTDLAFGPENGQSLDYFTCGTPNKPVLLFIHGGYWQSLDKSDFSFVAKPYLKHGVNIAVVNYRLAPSVSMDAIVDDNRAALGWLYRNADALGFNKNRIFVSGHSAGGHLTAAMVSTDWQALGLPGDLIKGGCAISGLYDLEPIRLCYLNKVLGLTEDQVARHSPARHLPKNKIPMILTAGGAESDEYHRLQREYAALLQGIGCSVRIAEQRDGHHFDVVDRLGDENTELFKAAVELVTRSD